ncbi:hypothetical protein [Alkaliphilus sp. B6464]|uniref:hypothetical protein n=1 Tax=Alkaliphilus sp. B6464 TaxID=2731219 RepID=UPI001BADA470|nr:hypothetical protein [Alkaliphilus sp. B6464]QUH22078.1 hypothetical protein HYG84_19420 [Alkaliphilus sp. B6464]
MINAILKSNYIATLITTSIAMNTNLDLLLDKLIVLAIDKVVTPVIETTTPQNVEISTMATVPYKIY